MFPKIKTEAPSKFKSEALSKFKSEASSKSKTEVPSKSKSAALSKSKSEQIDRIFNLVQVFQPHKTGASIRGETAVHLFHNNGIRMSFVYCEWDTPKSVRVSVDRVFYGLEEEWSDLENMIVKINGRE
ncbi:hypothetical protein BG000_001234 [Podila horticola]|nr:hypothetical protein BG000_001234 [Podila horticola]